MGKIIFRNDDVSFNTNFDEVIVMYSYLRKHVPDCEIWSVVSLCGKFSSNGSIYPDLPLRQQDRFYFYNIDFMGYKLPMDVDYHKVASHGLLHIDHSKLSRDAQEISILTSCKYLNTDIFVPPFSQYNEHTVQICEGNGIHLVKRSEGWRSLESEPFDRKEPRWFFHSWRFKTATEFIEAIQNASCKVG